MADWEKVSRCQRNLSFRKHDHANLLRTLGEQTLMARWQDARQALEESLSIVPCHYDTIKQLLATPTKLGDKDATLDLMGRLARLDPHNPTAFDAL